jgi:PleD family two-component response regulator
VRKVRILDDNIMDVMNASRYLKEAGYQVIRMSSPNGTLAKLEYEEPEILLLDITMNRLNVQGFLQSVQEDEANEDLIVVLFSDLDAETLQKYCLENDIHGYYCKSMDITKLPEFLDNFYEEDDEEYEDY